VEYGRGALNCLDHLDVIEPFFDEQICESPTDSAGDVIDTLDWRD
jgi:hypothetical protein